MQDKLTGLLDVSNEIQESLVRSYAIPDDVDEIELSGVGVVWMLWFHLGFKASSVFGPSPGSMVIFLSSRMSFVNLLSHAMNLRNL